MNTVALIRTSFNPRLALEGILLTMHTQTNLSKQVEDEVRGHFPDDVFTVVIPRNVRISESPSFGKPVILYDVRSKGAECYFAFAEEVIARDQKSTGEGARSPHPPQTA
jgi:chromosome partitioning protein